ncbi:uncharacterized protein PV09_09691 [Verruconis gallopava]|uniref:Protein kinase domain-containing protein n=1 Tax=Verruconis gallopava TaxID=253628 RepID=A0A0D2AHZ6_9PEZI|nr:uncharacterized protein PV09_09691 [Verruconis gallopava]KIV98503.1 hypothetical protein PV09_09691 [Verruconis gallopava]
MASAKSYPPPPLLPPQEPAIPATTQEQNSLVKLRYQGTSIIAECTPLECENHNTFHLTLRRNALDHAIYLALSHLTWLKRLIGGVRPVWLLPPQLILKKKKDGWESEFEHEIAQYIEHENLQGRVLPIYYGRGSYDNIDGILLSYCGTSLNERQDLTVDALKKKLRWALSWLADRNLVHKNLTLGNVLYDGSKITIIDLEQTDKQKSGFNINAEVDSILYWFKFRQKALREDTS